MSSKEMLLHDLDAVQQPIATAAGLPNASYTHGQCFDFERDHVLGTSWAGLEFISALTMSGYAKPADFMGLPLLITRDKAGRIRVFHNVCSHRGMILVREETEVRGLLRCPYHSWTYDTAGKLKGTPHIGGFGVHNVDGFDCNRHGLREIPSATWMGIIFINLSAAAGRFADCIAPIVNRWEAYAGRGALDGVCIAPTDSQLELDVGCNWKLAVDNYCEAYHLPWVHPALNRYSPLEQHYSIIAGDNASGQGSRTYDLSNVAGTSLPRFAAWPEDKLRHAEYLSLYPNVLLGLQADHVFALILRPLAPDRTLEKLELGYPGAESTGDQYQAARAVTLDSWRAVFNEDVIAVEGMQRGRRSSAYTGGVFSPIMETPTHHFHNWVARHYRAAAEGQST